MIYLDNAATTLYKPECVRKAVYEAMGSLGNSGRGLHEPTLEASRIVYETRKRAAEFFGFQDASRVAFTANATEALNIAIHGLVHPGDHIITTELEHNSVLRPLYQKEKEGMELTILKADKKGNISLSELENSVRQNTKAVICTHASNVTGNVLPLEQIGKICEKYGIYFMVDAAQTAGVIPIDRRKMGIHILCFTGHKGLMGPQGTGGICVDETICLPSFKIGGSGIHSFDREHPKEMPEALEAGTLNVHGIAGLHAAFGFLQQTGIEVIQKREQRLMELFYEGIQQIPGVKIYGDFDTKERSAVVSLNMKGYDSKEAGDALWQEYGIAVRAGIHCAPLMHRALGTQEQGTVRFSFSWFNTEEDVETAVRAVKELAEE